MAFELPTQPNYNVAPPQQTSPLEQYGKMLQLRALSGQVQQQQQLQPLQVEQAQQSVQAQDLENQQRQIALKTQQAQNTYWSNPAQFQAAPPVGGDQLAKMLGVADDDPILGMVRGQMKAGVPGNAAIADAKATLDFRKSVSQSTQEQQKVIDDAHTHLQTIATPILAETDPVKKAQLIQDARPGLMEWANYDPSVKAIIPQLTPQNFDAFANRLGAEKGALDLRSQSADVWKKELDNDQTANPLLKMQINPSEAFSGDKLPASIAYLTAKTNDPDPKVSTLATQLLGVANTSKNVELAIDKSKKAAEQTIQDGDPAAAGKLLHDGVVAPSQIISARKPEFAQKAFAAAAAYGDGWNAQKAEGDFKVASSPGNVAFFGSARSLTQPGGMLDQLKAAGKLIPENEFPVFNTFADIYKTQTGSGPIAAYAAKLIGVADDYAKVTGGGQGTEGMQKFIMSLAPAKASPEQRDGAIEGFRGAVQSQVDGRIGPNPVLQKMYGVEPPVAAKPASSAATPPVQVGQAVSIKGKPMKVTAIHPDGSFDAQ